MMIVLGLLLISSTAATLVWLTRPAPARHPSPLVTTAPGDRRTTRLQRQPERAHRSDLVRLLAAQVPASYAHFVLERGKRDAVPTGLLWAWTYRHGGALLTLVLAAGLSREDLEWHLSDPDSLDQDSLMLHAELNGHLFQTRPVSDLWRLVPLEATVERRP